MTRGEVRWCTFRAPDKRRPVVILTRDGVIPHLREVTVVPISTRVRGIASEVALGRADGMPNRCAASFDHVQSVYKDTLGAFITRLPPARMAEMRAALLFALGFSSVSFD